MTSIIKADNISTVSGSGNITIPTGVKVVGTDSSSLVAPGMHLQVVHSEYKSSTTVTGSGYHNIGHTITITPKYATSKILIEYHFNWGQYHTSSSTQDNMKRWTLYSDAATTGTFLNIAPSGYYHFFQHQNKVGTAINFGEQTQQSTIKYLHSPNTTNPVTYQIRATCDNTSAIVISYNSRGYGSQTERGICNAFATEIAQ